MKNSENNFTRIIKRRIFIIRSLITTLILFLIFIIFFILINNNKQDVLINVLGRQRMLSQMIAKDANHKYSVLRDMEIGDLSETDESFNNKLADINISLINTRNEFNNKFDSLKSGILNNDKFKYNIKKSLSNIDFTNKANIALWQDFSKSVDIIINSNKADDKTSEAINFINTHNKKLLNNWDYITKEFIDFQKQSANTYFITAITIFAIFIVSLYFSLSQLDTYLIEPLNEMYKGIKSFGLVINKNNNKKSLSTISELTPVIDEINNSFGKLNKLIELIENINKDISFDGILKYIYTSFSEFIPYSHIGIALLKDNGKILEASYGISHPDLSNLPKKLVGIKAELSVTSLENIVKNGTPRVINDLEEYTKNSDTVYNKILIEEGIKSSITLPLKINEKPVGIIFFSSIKKNIYKKEHIEFLKALSSSISISLNKNIFIDELLYSTLLALAKMAEERDEDTGEHLERMKRYSVKITEFLVEDNVYEDIINLNFLKDIERFSPMHDIGKVGIRDGVLLKPGKLTDEEFEEMKKHTIYGAEVLRIAEGNIAKQSQSMFKMGIEIAEGHQEKWNGTGYPYKKSGHDIPLSARIVAVADVLDALTSKRPYKKAFSFEDSFNSIVREKGRHFDPNIIDSVIKHKEELYQLYMSFHHT